MLWLDLLREQVAKKGQAEVGREIGYSSTTVCRLLNGKYNAGTKPPAAKIIEVYGGGNMTETIPEGYMKDSQGRLVPVESIKEIDLARDALVGEIIYRSLALAAQVSGFKKSVLGDIQAFIDLSAEKYGAELGGVKGNVTLSSFDGRYRVLRAVADRLEFDERLQAAKTLIDRCLRTWTADSRSEIRALIDSAFQVDKAGRINAKRILGLRRLNIDDPQWKRAMEAISDSLQVIGSRTYVRIYSRDPEGEYRQMALDFSGA